MSDAELTAALDHLREAASGAGIRATAVDDDAAAFAAGICADDPQAASAWAEAFGRPVASFAETAGRGRASRERPTPVLARLLAAGDSDAAEAYARSLADIASIAATLDDPSIDGINAAGFAASAQLRAVDPSGRLFVPAALAVALNRGMGAPVAVATPTPAEIPTATAPSPGATAAASEAPAPTLAELLAKLDGLVGLTTVKDEVHHQAELLRIDKLRTEHRLKTPDVSRHLVFVGNPGTGKTTVARLVAALKTADVVKSAVGGVLFIDEAYALATDDFGQEAIATLVKAMEDHRDELVLIVAGYTDEMATFIDSNPGLSSRFRTIVFPDYTDDELVAIFRSQCADADFTPTDDCVSLLRTMVTSVVRDREFGNARYVRNVFEAAVVRQAWRLRTVEQPTIDQLRTLEAEDLPAPAP